MRLTLNKDKLTLGDLEDFEEVSGQSLDRILEAVDGAGASAVSGLPIKSLLALLWISGRTEDPNLTYQDVRNTPLSDLELVEIDVTGEDETDPTSASV